MKEKHSISESRRSAPWSNWSSIRRVPYWRRLALLVSLGSWWQRFPNTSSSLSEMKKRSESNIASWATASIQVLRIWYVSLTAFGLLDLCLKFFWLKHEQKWPINVGTRIYHRPTDPEGGKLEANLTSRNTKQWTFLYRESDFQRWNVFSICVFSPECKKCRSHLNPSAAFPGSSHTARSWGRGMAKLANGQAASAGKPCMNRSCYRMVAGLRLHTSWKLGEKLEVDPKLWSPL